VVIVAFDPRSLYLFQEKESVLVTVDVICQ